MSGPSQARHWQLEDEYRRLALGHRMATIRMTARSSLPPSVTRVFAAGTKDVLVEVLGRLPVDEIPSLESEAAYRLWFERQLDRVAEAILRLNPSTVRPQVHPGYKWGHATKALALFVRDLVLFSRYFTDAEVERVAPWLCCPIDGLVLKRLRELGERPPVRQINQLDSAARYWALQDLLEDAARTVGVPRAWFDDNWGDRADS